MTGSFKQIARDHWGVKLLGRGAEDFDMPITIEVQQASQSAITAVENAGGSIVCKYYNKLGLRALMLVGAAARVCQSLMCGIFDFRAPGHPSLASPVPR